MTFQRTYRENDVPSMKKAGKLLDHHPHHGFPAHGIVREAPKHMRKTIWKPEKVKG